MTARIPQVHLNIPDVFQQLEVAPATLPEERMRLVQEWVGLNLTTGGGPFAAGIFDLETGSCLSIGVNRVVQTHCSLAHAEVMAIMLAQQAAAHHDLSASGNWVLTSSAEPCAQCFGAIPWSGIRTLEYGATREDVENIGFDEGPKPEAWEDALRARGIQVSGPLLREEAVRQLRRYQEMGGEIYNGGSTLTD